MTAEGTFPKIDGDVLYASEVNGFYGAGHIVSSGTNYWLTSGNTGAGSVYDLGSLSLIGELTNPCFINVYGTTGVINAGAGSRAGMKVVLVGAGSLQGNINLDLDSAIANSTGIYKFFIGSPYPIQSIITTNFYASTSSQSRGANDTSVWNNGSLWLYFYGVTNVATGSAVFNFITKVENFY